MGLNINNLSKQFGDFTAVDDLNFTVEEGDMYGLLGGNGAGKTTTFRMILNILKPTSGSVTFNDKKIDYNFTDYIGYLPEERGLHPKLTVEEQVLYLAQLKNMSKQDAKKQLEYWLERFKVSENMKKKSERYLKGTSKKFNSLRVLSIIQSYSYSTSRFLD